MTSGKGAILKRIVAVVNKFGFDDGDKMTILADFGIMCEVATVFVDSGLGRGENIAFFIKGESEGGAPFGETEAEIIVLLETRS